VNQPLAWIDITAKDAARSRKFYGVLFDWNIDVNESMNYGLVTPTLEHLPGGIGQASDENPHPPRLVTYFAVPDVETALGRAGRLGGTTVVPTWEIPGLGKMAVFHDPDGNRVGLWEV